MAARDWPRARTAPVDAGRPLAAGMPRVFERRAGCSGTVVHLRMGFGGPGGAWQWTPVACAHQISRKGAPAFRRGEEFRETFARFLYFAVLLDHAPKTLQNLEHQL